MKSAAITNEALAQKLNVISNTVQLWFKKDVKFEKWTYITFII